MLRFYHEITLCSTTPAGPSNETYHQPTRRNGHKVGSGTICQHLLRLKTGQVVVQTQIHSITVCGLKLKRKCAEKKSIVSALKKIEMNTICATIDEFPIGFQKCVAAKGDHFE